MKKSVFLIALCLSFFTESALAHGVTITTTVEGRVIVVSSLYAHNQPLVDASVSVYSPADPGNVWQTGRTDQTGHFAFVPDREGEWTIVIDDRQGHLKRTAVVFTPEIPGEGEMTEERELVEEGGMAEVSEIMEESVMTGERELNDEVVTRPAPPAESGWSTIHKVIMGLSLIIGMTGLFYGLKARQERKSE